MSEPATTLPQQQESTVNQFQYQPGVWAGSVPDPLPPKPNVERKHSAGLAETLHHTWDNAKHLLGSVSHKFRVWHEIDAAREEFHSRFHLPEETPLRAPWACKLLSGQERVAGKLYLTKQYLAFRESKSERPEKRVQLLIPMSQIVSIQRARGVAGSFYLTRDFAEHIDALALYEKEGLVHSFADFEAASDLEELYSLLDEQWRRLLESTPATLLEQCRDVPDGQNVPLQRCSSIFEPAPSDPRVPSVFVQQRSEGQFKPRVLPMTREPIRARVESELLRKEIAAAELYHMKAHPRLAPEVRQSIESFDKSSMNHFTQPSAGRSQSLSANQPAMAQLEALRPRAESLPETILRDIRYYGMYRVLRHVSPAHQRVMLRHQLGLPEYRKYSAPAELREEVERFEFDRLRHCEPPQAKPLEQILALNEYEPKPPQLLEAIRGFDKSKLRHQRTRSALRPAKLFAQWHLLLRQIDLFRRSNLRHVLPDRRPCYPLYVDETDSDEWWQRTFFAGRTRLERFVLHAKSSSESRFAIIADGKPQEIKISKPVVNLEKEVRASAHKKKGISATIATETHNAAGLA